ncbi:hypothetical protein BVE84_04085 [Streptococcus azizii]|uniref:DUF2628 domain-containing protein n=1 Tax=Streptococcus azizii TaxID=1579424 RepID=A0AB36JP21_9STRE|nr:MULTISPECIES: DUF2628 domain-containing protein [Streptococcus]MBF0775524.1 hypothetical protein [Streptococcus sp. 19428wD3_AN2]ONK27238.1 hypothetical protein BVE86_05280 [Streptococcus azizii]ONK27687.1 hypothetical protein BVE85_05865 [Streptococcus azizii]ONK29866.1 hypothetical protein BVE84_04085 [Streptococcus azizii]TFU84415.1 hypothetical protein E4T83_01860 [Streptococcus sp. AN2]
MKVTVMSPIGQMKQVPVGFSWTALLFGFFVPLFRQDWKWAGIMLGVGIVLGALSNSLNIPYSVLGVGVVWGMLYNKLHIKELLAKGWTPATDLDAEIIRTKASL